MTRSPAPPSSLRFGPFELEPEGLVLRRQGRRVALQQQPAKLLALLASRPGEVVSREDIEGHLWGGRAVDSTAGIHVCVSQLRHALGDRAEAPLYVETVPRRGYRFVAPLRPAEASGPSRRAGWRWALAVAALAVAAVALTALRWPSGPRSPRAAAPQRSMLVVLPFANPGGDQTDEYFADGLTEELITTLAGLDPQRLAIIARSSAMRYKHRVPELQQLAADLGVDYVLQGSVRRRGDLRRIAVQLVAVADRTHLWAERWDRRIGDALALQDEVAAYVAQALALRLLTRAPPPEPPPVAREAYLAARYHLYSGGREDLDRALELLAEVRRQAPSFAPALVAEGRAYFLYPDSPLRTMPAAKAAAEGAVELAPQDAEAQLLLGDVRLFFEWDPAAAGAAYRRALALAPGSAAVRKGNAFYLSALARHDEALEQLAEALRLDPVSVRLHGDAGFFLLRARRPGEAAEQCRRALELEPDDRPAHLCALLALEAIGQLAEARAHAEALIRTAGGGEVDPAATFVDGSGLVGYWRWQRERLAARPSAPPLRVALVAASLGDAETALDALEQAWAERSPFMPFLAVDPQLDPLRAEPRFQALLARVAGGSR